MTETQNRFTEIGAYYDRLVRKYGHDHRSADYGRPESQTIKFAVLSDVLPMDGLSVLDVGCGFADYSKYLGERFRDVRYTGIDISKEMVQEARRAHPDVSILHQNIMDKDIGQHDVVSANGIFYLLGNDSSPLMKSIINRMYSISRRAVSFNTLSCLANNKEEGEFYADPADILKYCLGLSRKAVLRHDYHARDFTVYLYKE